MNSTRHIEIKGVIFEPLYWSFTEDGIYGKMYFTVPKNTYNVEGSNNGAYSSDKEYIPDIFYGKMDKDPNLLKKFWDPERYNSDKQLVFVAVDCVENPEDLRKMSLLDIFTTMAYFIDTNISRVKN